MTDILSAQITVTSARAKIVSAIPNGQSIIISNRDATNSLFVGNSGVTTANGTEVKANTQLGVSPIVLPAETELWAVTAAAQTARLDLLQIVAD